MKTYTPDELQEHKENLAEVSIQIDEIEAEKKEQMKQFKEKLDPLQNAKKTLLENIRAKAEYVKEECYKFTDQEERMTGFYNKDGELVELRPATANELQTTIFSIIPKTGTNDDLQ